MDLWYPLSFFSVILFLVYKYINRNHEYWQKRGVYSLKPLPIVGNLKDVLTSKYHVGEWLQIVYQSAKEQPYIGMYMLDTPVLVLRCPKIIKDVLQKDFNYFDNRTATAPDHDKLLRSMIFLAKNPTWRTIRQKLTPMYTSGKLKAMFPLVRQVGETMTKYLKRNIPHPSVDAREVTSRYANEVISKTAFAIDAGCFESDDCEFRKWGRIVEQPRFLPQMMTFFTPILVKYFKPKFMHEGARKFFGSIFQKSLELREQSDTKGNDLIDILVTLKQNDTTGFWEDDVLLAQAFQIFFAGTETTSSGISYTLHELALQPHIQNKLRLEIKNMLEENYGKIEQEPLLNLKYLHMCVSETFRKYPGLPFLDRLCNTDYKVGSTGLVIEKGTKVYIPTLGLGYDEKYFPNPEKYDPERFSDMNTINQDGLYYIPFGEGPRICIGERFGLMSVKLALAHILSNFEVEPSSKTIAKPGIVKRQIFLLPEGGLPVKFKSLS